MTGKGHRPARKGSPNEPGVRKRWTGAPIACFLSQRQRRARCSGARRLTPVVRAELVPLLSGSYEYVPPACEASPNHPAPNCGPLTLVLPPPWLHLSPPHWTVEATLLCGGRQARPSRRSSFGFLSPGTAPGWGGCSLCISEGWVSVDTATSLPAPCPLPPPHALGHPPWQGQLRPASTAPPPHVMSPLPVQLGLLPKRHLHPSSPSHPTLPQPARSSTSVMQN